MAMVLLGTPVTTFGVEEAHTVVNVSWDDGNVFGGLDQLKSLLPGTIVRLDCPTTGLMSVHACVTLNGNVLAESWPDTESPFSELIRLGPGELVFSWGDLHGSCSVVAPDFASWSTSVLRPGTAGFALTLPPTVSFCSHPDCIPTLTSSNPDVAAVSGGPSEGWSVSPVSAGTATLMLTTGGVTNWTGTVKVAAAVPVTGVSLSETTKTLTVGESFDLTATVTPENATDQAITWTVDNYDTAGFVNDAGQVVASLTTAAGSSQSVTVKGLEAGSATISAKTSDSSNITATCVVTVTEAGDTPPPATTPDSTPGTTPTAPPAATPADSSYLEAAVAVRGQQQRLRVYDPNGVLPDGTKFEALAVTEHEHLDDDHEIEHLLAYDLSLLDASGNPLHMPLDAPVELCFEVLDGLDKDELEVVLVQEFDDAEFEETLANLDGASWVKVKTDHFSPYALIDKLTPKEKGVQVQDDPSPENNVTTGDQAVQVAVAGLGMTLVLALGIMLRLITNKRKFEE